MSLPHPHLPGHRASCGLVSIPDCAECGGDRGENLWPSPLFRGRSSPVEKFPKSSGTKFLKLTSRTAPARLSCPVSWAPSESTPETISGAQLAPDIGRVSPSENPINHLNVTRRNIFAWFLRSLSLKKVSVWFRKGCAVSTSFGIHSFRNHSPFPPVQTTPLEN